MPQDFFFPFGMRVDINNKFLFLKILSPWSLLPFKINFGKQVAIIH